jgi:hypothetical protein
MARVKSLDDLERAREDALRQREERRAAGTVEIAVSMGSPALAAGAREVARSWNHWRAAAASRARARPIR